MRNFPGLFHSIADDNSHLACQMTWNSHDICIGFSGLSFE